LLSSPTPANIEVNKAMGACVWERNQPLKERGYEYEYERSLRSAYSLERVAGNGGSGANQSITEERVYAGVYVSPSTSVRSNVSRGSYLQMESPILASAVLSQQLVAPCQSIDQCQADNGILIQFYLSSPPSAYSQCKGN